MSDAGTHRVHYACKYAPVELLCGFGAEVCPIDLEPESFEVAESVAHGNLCGFGKALLAAALSGDVHELVLTNCCDVMRRVYDVIESERCVDFLWMVDVPHRVGPAEEGLLRARLARLAEAYGEHSGRSFDAGLALASLVDPEPIPQGTVSLVGAHAGASLLSELEASLPQGIANHTCTGDRLLAEPPLALSRPASAGCGACGESGGDGRLGEFLDWYAGALLTQSPCMRMSDSEGRGGLLGGVSGTVYHSMKFCDYYGFEYAEVVAMASEAPVLKVETDGTATSAGQLRTRIEAFAETLGAAPEPPTTPTDESRGATRSPEPTLGQTPEGESMSSAAPNNRQTYVLGVDSGSTSTDAVIVDSKGSMVGSAIVPTGAKATAAAERAIKSAMDDAGVRPDDIVLRVSTGYGRDAIPGMDRTVTEITCHARGAHALLPQARTIVDIGGQDSKVIALKPDGSVANFVMNDKCAAGTGRFLETMARTLEMTLPEFCEAGLSWRNEVTISSMCTVFAESEVVSLVANDTPTPDVIHGLDVAVARKTAALSKRVGGMGPYLMTGGVAQNQGVVAALEDALGEKVVTHEDSQLCGALGAALIGLMGLARS